MRESQRHSNETTPASFSSQFWDFFVERNLGGNRTAVAADRLYVLDCGQGHANDESRLDGGRETLESPSISPSAAT